MSSNPESETGLLQIRLAVASLGAVIIGFLSATYGIEVASGGHGERCSDSTSASVFKFEIGRTISPGPDLRFCRPLGSANPTNIATSGDRCRYDLISETHD